MNPQPSESSNAGMSSSWDSRDCIDVVYDGEGDTTVRPIPPEWLPQALAEIEKLKRWGAWPYGNKPDQNPPKGESPSV